MATKTTTKQKSAQRKSTEQHTHVLPPRKMAECRLRLVGTAPILVAHTMPWDVGAVYWEAQPAEIAKNKIKRPNTAQVKMLERVCRNGYDLPCAPYDADKGLNIYQEAICRGYWLPDGAPAFPVSGFLGAIATGAVQYNGKAYGMPAKKLRSLLLTGDELDGTLARISTPRVGFHEDMGIGTTGVPRHIVRLHLDLPWETTLTVKYSSGLFDEKNIAQALQWAGDFGIGQRRPSSPHGGQYGTFRIATTEDK